MTRPRPLQTKALRFAKAEEGATAIEYAVIAAAMALMLIVALPGVAAAISGLFNALVAGFPSG